MEDSEREVSSGGKKIPTDIFVHKKYIIGKCDRVLGAFKGKS